MRLSIARLFLTGAAALVLTVAAAPALADPWAMPGDLALRNDIQLMSDAGVLKSPVTTWPIPWATLVQDLDSAESVDALTPEVVAARTRVLQRFDRIRASNGLQPNAKIGVRSDAFWLRTFEDTPREDAEIRGGLSWMGERLAARAQASFAPDPLPNDQEWRADGSYLAGTIGNHILSVGALDRWWGPSWDDTLVLSSNARPVPGFALERNAALPFEHKWLSWIGPWNYSFFWGFLGSDREIPNARLMAFRLAFRPFPELEVGLSRTAVWCGSGRPCDTDTFGNVVLGKDNPGEGSITDENQPGDQMFAWDARMLSPIGDLPYAIYTQWVAEDEVRYRPSLWFGQIGVETWGTLKADFLTGTWRGHLEVTNTLGEFWEGEPADNTVYNHTVYLSGHRFEGRSLGAAMDGDSLGVSAGLEVIDASGQAWTARLRWAELNQDGIGIGTDAMHSVAPRELRILGANVSHRREVTAEGVSLGFIGLGVGVQRSEDGLTGDADTDAQAFLQWTWDMSGL